MLCLICLKLQIPLESFVEKKTGLQVKFGLNFFENLKIKAKYLRSLKHCKLTKQGCLNRP